MKRALLSIFIALPLAAQPPVYTNPAAHVEMRVDDLLSRMTLEEKIDLLGGIENMYIKGNERLGIPRIRMSDGPVGVRCYGESTAYPAGICLAASWDTNLAQRVGRALGWDCRARGVHILLAPGMNIHRQYMCGRNFEYFGEDPFLDARITVGYVNGVQGERVAATIKHYACNNFELERNSVNVKVDDRTLHEIYLPPFKAGVTEAGAWAVMAAYNKVNGAYCAENDVLLNQILKDGWGFKGVAMSDWGAVHSTLGTLRGGLDLEMPSGRFLNEKSIKPLLAEGTIEEGLISEKIRRILRLIFSMGWFDSEQEDTAIPKDNPASAAVALDAARGGIVLLKNDGNLLPLDRARKPRIAVLGPNADPAVTGGGGSSFTKPFHAVSVLDGVRALAGTNATVEYVPWQDTSLYARYFANLNAQSITGGVAIAGLKGEYFANADMTGTPAFVRQDAAINFDWLTNAPGAGLPSDGFSVRWTGTITPAQTGEYLFVAQSDDGIRVSLGRRRIINNWSDHAVETKTAFTHLDGGRTYLLRVEYYDGRADAIARFGWGTVGQTAWPKEQRDAIAAADAVVACVGFSVLGRESEGSDRPFVLPGGQDELIRSVAAINPRTIVVINAGGAVEMQSWIDRVAAVFHAWYPGQEGGTALAGMLFGDVNPSGKLPVSFEKRWEDSGAYGTYPPENGEVTYSDGIFVGYRHFDAKDTEPQFCFGHGLSYTAFAYTNLAVTATAHGCTVTFDVRNAGTRAGAETAQVYVHDVEAAVPRPPKELKGFAKVLLQPGETKRVTVTLDRDAFAYYDAAKKDWAVEPGVFEILVGASSRDIRLKGQTVK
ncbi:hypothetical protein GX586_11640 [bacterium]|nr:hypothetical protein [bacterium]